MHVQIHSYTQIKIIDQHYFFEENDNNLGLYSKVEEGNKIHKVF